MTPSQSPMFTTTDRSDKESPYALNLQLGQIINRLRDPSPPPPPPTSEFLPPPVLSRGPWRFTNNVLALAMTARMRAQARARIDGNTGLQEQREGNQGSSQRRTVPGGFDSEDVT